MIDKALSNLGVSGFIIEGNPSSETEFLQSFKKVIGTNENDEAILSSDPKDFGVTWTQVSAKLTELQNAEPMRLLREKRDRLLAETDWWASSDLTMTQAQTDYRQALRDITNSYTSLDDVVWPTKP